MVVPPTISAIGMSRDDLRFSLRKRRQCIQNKSFISSIPPQLVALLKNARSIGSYVPIGSEMRPSIIDRWCIENDKSLYFPWFSSRSSDMVFKLFVPDDAVEVGPFSFQQPLETAPDGVPDVLIVPMLGFDRAMNRLGQGKGHYDRFLAKYPRTIRIGFAHSCQEVDQLPVEPWDMPLHAVLTEHEWIESAV